MKKQFIFWMLISLFMMSPSYAQENKEAEGNNASVADKSMDKATAIDILLDPSSDKKAQEQAKEIASDNLTVNQVKDLNSIKEVRKNINKLGFTNLSEINNIIDSIKNNSLSTSDALGSIKKVNSNILKTMDIKKRDIKQYKDDATKVIDDLKNNLLSSFEALEKMQEIKQQEENEKAMKNATPKGQTTQNVKEKDNKPKAIPTSEGIDDPIKDNEIDPKEQIEALNKIIELKNDTIKDLNAKLTKIYTDNFIKTWGPTQFSKFDVDLFNHDYMEIQKNLSEIPNNVQKIKDDYEIYLKGYQCVNSPYDSLAIKSIKETIWQLYENTEDNLKKADLEKLNGQLYDYKNTVKIFKLQVIDKVQSKKRSSVQEPQDWVNDIFKEIVPAYLNEIQKIPWLNDQLNTYKTLLSSGKTTDQKKLESTITKIYNDILLYQEPQPQEEQEPQPQEGQEPQPQELYGTPIPIQ